MERERETRSAEGETTDERVLHVEHDEADEPSEVTLDREQTIRDLRELQELTVERASGRSSPSDDES